MLRSVILENFVGFKTKQCVRFPENESPSIFVGENGSGKSSLLEGIRRCLTSARSTTRSSAYDERSPSYFICQYDIRKCDEPLKRNGDTLFSGIISLPGQTYYKFVSTPSELLIDEHKDSVCQYQEPNHTLSKNIFGEIQESFEKTSLNIETIIGTDRVYLPINSSDPRAKSALENRLEMLEKHIIMTLPLRSIGPLQWSLSKRIATGERDKNYSEASQRAEIITYFLERKDEHDKFDLDKESAYFKGLTGRGDIIFELAQDENQIIVKSTETKLPGGKYALLKTPEGILEAKYFSILLSSKRFLTLILEEPDRGMHPQMIDRMMSIIGKEKKNKQIVLTTHNQCFIRPTTISKLTIFKRKKLEDNGQFQTKTISGTKLVALKVKPDGRAKVKADTSSTTDVCTEREETRVSLKELRVLTQDHLANLIFAKKILFCEGHSDWLFITTLQEHIMEPSEGVLHVLSLIMNGQTVQHIDDVIEKLQNEILSLQVLSISGWSNAKTMRKVCNELELEHAFLFDKDAIIESKTGKSLIISHDEFTGYREIEQKFKGVDMSDEVNWDNMRRDLRSINIFSWRDGTIEDMLMSLLRNETTRIMLTEAEGHGYDCEVKWQEKRKLIEDLEIENVCLPVGRWKEKRSKYRSSHDTAAEKLFIDSSVKQENINRSVELFLNACGDESDDLVQFIDFLVPGGLSPSIIDDPKPSTSDVSSMELGSQ